MKIDLKKETVTIYQVKCSLCGQKIQSAEKDGCKELLSKHVDNECESVKTMRGWEKEGIFKEMMALLRLEGLNKHLKKLLKHYTIEEIKEALENLGEE